MANDPRRSKLMSMRFRPPQYDLVQRASEHLNVYPTEFVRDAAVARAKHVLKQQETEVARSSRSGHSEM